MRVEDIEDIDYDGKEREQEKREAIERRMRVEDIEDIDYDGKER